MAHLQRIFLFGTNTNVWSPVLYFSNFQIWLCVRVWDWVQVGTSNFETATFSGLAFLPVANQERGMLWEWDRSQLKACDQEDVLVVWSECRYWICHSGLCVKFVTKSFFALYLSSSGEAQGPFLIKLWACVRGPYRNTVRFWCVRESSGHLWFLLKV